MHTRFAGPVLPAALLLVFLGAAAPAQAVTFIFQDRSFSGSVREQGILRASDARHATDFAPYNDALTVSYDSMLTASASASGRQNSTLLPSVVTASARATAGVGGQHPPMSANAANAFTIRFNVPAPTAYSLSGTMFWSQAGVPEPFAVLDVQILLTRTGDATPVVDINRLDSFSGTHTFTGANARTGTLLPGAYQLSAIISASSGMANVSCIGEYAFELQVPAPGASTALLAGAALAAPRRRRAPRA